MRGHTIERTAQRIEGFRHGLAKTTGCSSTSSIPWTAPAPSPTAWRPSTRSSTSCPAATPSSLAPTFRPQAPRPAALDRGIAVPGQVAIAGYGDLEFTQHVRPRSPHRRSSELRDGPRGRPHADQALNGETIANPIVLQPISLEARASTTILPKGRILPSHPIPPWRGEERATSPEA